MNLNDFHVLFCGIARDNAGEMPAVLRSIDETGRLFGSYRTVVYENDSSDQTLDILMEWKKNSGSAVKVISETHNLKKRPNLQFLAYCRNQYLQEINNPEYDSYTHVIMVDFDLSCGWPVAGVIDSFQQHDWQVMAANSIYTREGNMWDAFPFRTEEINEPYSYEKYGPIENYWPILHTPAHHKIYPPGTPLVPVYSAFGGLCIYQKNILKGLSYDLESEDCEHVSLHKAIRDRSGKIYMNPTMIVIYGDVRKTY